jgi:hypothetical protein
MYNYFFNFGNLLMLAVYVFALYITVHNLKTGGFKPKHVAVIVFNQQSRTFYGSLLVTSHIKHNGMNNKDSSMCRFFT